ncbi:MFS transporter [Sphaerisporangium album]|uniref:MFS transporter n=1 Tax=Sphaerisporangium album TaxID=509200 RepID=A0A367FDJ4_9ACTN|nr:MFS transporter [Sphaerisporangium album]
MVFILALACGVSVANVYFAQAISPLIASGLGVSQDSAALVTTATQVGYAAGLFLLVPLGDRVRHRPLIVTLLLLTGLGLTAASLAPALGFLVGASAVVGITTVVPQIIIPMAAGLVPDGRRGALVGTLLGGLLAGVLLARTFGGVVGEWLGWRGPYIVAAGLALVLAAVLAVTVPTTAPTSRERYPSLLAATLRLLRTEPDLRRSVFYQAMLFAGFSAAWTSLALLIDGPVYGFGAQVVGLIALAGAGAVFCTPVAGRWVDRKGPEVVTLVCVLGAIVAAGVLVAGSLGGGVGLAAVILGMLLLDIAVQCGQVANQARIFALRPEARSRLNTVYMTGTFTGASVGSWLGVRAFMLWGWYAVCGLVATLALLALLRHTLRRSTQGAAAQAPHRTEAPTSP